MKISSIIHIVVIAIATIFLSPRVVVAQSQHATLPQLGKIIVQKLHSDDTPPPLQHRVWYTNANHTCQVYVERDGSILALGNDDGYYDDGRQLRESISIAKVNGKVHVEQSLAIVDGTSRSKAENAYPVFWVNCRVAANRDLPSSVKAKFYNFLK